MPLKQFIARMKYLHQYKVTCCPPWEQIVQLHEDASVPSRGRQGCVVNTVVIAP